MSASDTTRTLVNVMVAVLCGGALLAIAAIVSGSKFGDDSARAIGSAVAIAFFSLTGVAGSNLAQRRPELSAFGFLTAAVSALAAVVMLISIWTDGLSGDSWRPAVYTGLLAFAGGHASVLLSSLHDTANVRAIRNATLGALALLLTLTLIEMSSPGTDIGAQPIGVLAVLYVLGTIVVALLRRATPATAGAVTATPSSAPFSANGRLPSDHPCLIWEGTAESALAELHQHGYQVLAGPAPGIGSRGRCQTVYYRDPNDGSLLQLAVYGGSAS